MLPRACGHASGPAPQRTNNTIKEQIQKHEQTRDSIKKEAIKTRSVQEAAKKTYRKKVQALVQRDSPCRDTVFQIVNLCDTVIFIDSVLIAQLKEVIKQDSLIIQDQNKLIRVDSLTISDLTKSVKKEKRKSWFKGFKAGFITGNITGFVGSQLTKK